MGELRIIDGKHGDVAVRWKETDVASVVAAAEAFLRAQERGMVLIEPGTETREGRVLREFDPKAERIVATPRIQGG